MKPYLKIIEQPQTHYRFRYESENKYPHINGESSYENNVTYPSVELMNYKGKALMKCELYQVDRDEKHYHQLLHRDEENVSSNIVPNQGSYKFCFSEKSIVFKTKKEILKILNQKYKRLFPNYHNKQIKQLCQNNIDNNMVNKVRLRFSAHDFHSYKEICAVYSQPIQDARCSATNKLQIAWCSKIFGEASGGTEVGLFTEKISKNATEVHFKQNKDGHEILIGKGEIIHWHHSYALRFRTPPYIDRDITEKEEVFIQLVRTVNGNISTSNKITYTYTPNNYRKRKYSNRKETFGNFFNKNHQHSTHTDQTNQPITNLVPNMSATAQLRQARIPSKQKNFNVNNFVNSFDTVNSNTNQMSVPYTYVDMPTYQIMTPTPSYSSNEGSSSDGIYGDDRIHRRLIEFPETTSILVGNGTQIVTENNTLGVLDNTVSQDLMMEQLMNGWLQPGGHSQMSLLPEYDTPQTLDQHDDQNNDLSPPFGANSAEEFMRFTESLDIDMGILFGDGYQSDGGGAKETDQKPKEPLDLKKEKESEPTAFFNPKDLTKVKKLIKEIYENLRSGRRDKVKEALVLLCEIRLTDGGTFLHMMTEKNQEKLEIIVKLISSMKMLDILNSSNDFGQSILHAAVMTRNPRLASFLVAKGCDPRLEDYEGNNSIHYAVKYDAECLKHLLTTIKENDIPFDLNALNFEKQTALHLAALYGSAESVSALLAAGADRRTHSNTAGYVDEIDGRGRTALQIVCGSNYTDKTSEIIKLLLSQEADPFKPSRDGKSAVDYAKSKPQMWEALKIELLELNIEKNVASDSEDEYFSADEELNGSEDLTTKLQEMTLKEDSELP